MQWLMDNTVMRLLPFRACLTTHEVLLAVGAKWALSSTVTFIDGILELICLRVLVWILREETRRQGLPDLDWDIETMTAFGFYVLIGGAPLHSALLVFKAYRKGRLMILDI